MDEERKLILDATCGGRSIWFDKHDPHTVYMDVRRDYFSDIWKNGNCHGEYLINPDVQADFTAIPFPDETFRLVVFDPPHLVRASYEAWLVKKYGKLEENWPQMLREGFRECMRVLKPEGVLIFKWSEHDIAAEKVWEAIGHRPLFGHHSGKKSMTFWGCFMKFGKEETS